MYIHNDEFGSIELPEDTAGLELYQYKDWEPYLRKVFKEYLGAESNAIDIGAHIGIHTVFLSKLCRNGKVFSFEPNIKIRDLIIRNITHNKCKNVRFYPYAVGQKNEIGYLTEEENSFLSQFSQVKTKQKICIVSLDSFDFPKIDLIKMDAEGSELDILKGATAVIQRDQPIIILEIWQNNLTLYLEFMQSISYNVHKLDADNYLAYPIKGQNLNDHLPICFRSSAG